MKLSQFNVFFVREGEMFVANTFSKAVIKLDQRHYDALTSGMPSRINDIKDDIDVLAKQGVLVPDDVDELGLLRFAYEQAKYSPEDMEFVVAPTMNCNFACPYCFESHRSGRMSEETQDLFLSFFEEKVSIEGCKQVFFIWFGGEPLLASDIIIRMTPILVETCKRHGVDIFVNLITNGYLLTKSLVEELEACGVEHLQITIDGDKEEHDSRRVLKSGAPTFDAIFGNLRLFENSKMTVAVRVNVDASNLDAFETVSSKISELGNPRIECHPAIVVPASNQDEEQKGACLSRSMEESFYKDKVRSYYLEDKRTTLASRVINCGAEHYYSYVIDEEGLVYKCWNSIGRTGQALFSLKNPDERNPAIVSKYLGRDPFSEEECRRCSYLPICAGGCLDQYFLKGEHECPAEKYLFEDMLSKSTIDRQSNRR